MLFRNAYTALTPDVADCAFPPYPEPSVLSQTAPGPPDVSCCSRGKLLWSSTVSCVLEVIERNTGLLLVAASQGFFSLTNVAVKILNSVDPPVSTPQLLFVRMGITYICCIIYMFWRKVPDPYLGPKGVRLLLAFRGFSGFFGLFGVYYSLQYLSLSDATVLTFLSPMCTAIVGALVLKETFTFKEALAGIFSLFGVVLIARPAFLFDHLPHLPELTPAVDGINTPPGVSGAATPAERLLAVGVALVGVLGATGAYTSIRAIGKRAHPLHALVSFSTFCIIISSVTMFATHTTFVIPARLDWFALLITIGVAGFIAQILLTMGLQRETAGRGTMAVYVQIIFAIILEQVFFHTTPSILSIFGTVIILTSAIYVAMTKKNEKKSSNRAGEDLALEEGLLENVDEDTKAPENLPTEAVPKRPES